MTTKASIDGRTKVVALIGSPIGHSLSPAIHNLSFDLCGVNAAYVCFDVGAEAVPLLIPAFKEAGFAGLNVTMPIKRAVIPYLDELSPDAKLMGTVNVIHFTDGKAIGYNADGPGYVRCLKKFGVDLPSTTLTLLGPGGAGAPIIVSCALEGMKEINVFARAAGASYQATAEMLPRLAQRSDTPVNLYDFADEAALKEAIDRSDIVVNATNVGMGDDRHTPIPTELIRPGMMVADAIYHPLETQFLAEAKAKGCKTMNGMGLLIEQAAIGEKIWFGVDMPVDQITETILRDHPMN